MVNPNTYVDLFREVIGFEVMREHVGQAGFNLAALENNIDNENERQVLPGNTDREAERYKASVILQLLGGTLFPNSTGRFVPVEFLPLLRTPEITAQFSWGSAVLANLYRNLCKVALKKTDKPRFCGCALLLQLWAWSRIILVRPEVRVVNNDRHGPLREDEPHGARWRIRRLFNGTSRFSVRNYRDQFDGSLLRHVVWTPADGRNTVREAFIPTYNEWRNNRFNHLVEDEMEPLPPNYVGDGCVENYINWFYFYGRRFIRNPAHHLEIGVDGSAGSLAIAVNALRRVRDSVLDAPAHEIQQVAAEALVNIERQERIANYVPPIVPEHSESSSHAEEMDTFLGGGAGTSCAVMGIEDETMWNVFVSKAKNFGLLEIYISAEQSGVGTSTSRPPEDAMCRRRVSIAQHVEAIDNPESDSDLEDSNSDGDETELRWIEETRKEAESGRKRYTPDVVVQENMIFPSFESLEDAITKDCIKDLKVWTLEYKRERSWACRCWYHDGNPRCYWRAQAAKGKKSDHWLLKNYHQRHTCRPDYSHGGDDRNITSQFIARMIVGKLRVDPEYKVKLIRHEVTELYKVPVSYKKCWLARLIASETLYGSWKNSYKQVPILLQALVSSYPGTVVDFVCTSPPTDLNTEPVIGVNFKYAFWAFPAAINGLQHCLPVVTVDGTHLYGKYKGHLLLAVALNGNREIFPHAYAVVDGESTDSWSWFLRLVAQKVIAGERVCVISDRHAGIMNAYRDVEELQTGNIVKRFCLRHIRSNFNSKFHNKKLKDLMWSAGSTPSVQEFQDCMQEIRSQSEQAYQYLVEIPLQLWTQAYDNGSRCGILTTNSSESFNNMLKGCRMLPRALKICDDRNKIIATVNNILPTDTILHLKKKVSLRFTDVPVWKFSLSLVFDERLPPTPLEVHKRVADYDLLVDGSEIKATLA
ncbi:unnamed protein product [Cuscuta campestris]|uniref:Aminotransferase-like plant mobile domain-containing protein n=1 Tax=Cuscuta campestris TaxID=132261 RepID=A0A484L0F5_9ASTE|nr:unnamed protein product [Cuscuta campestris]